MSHLFKNNLKIYFKIFKYSLFFFILLIFYNGFISYEGNLILYTSFSIISNFLLFFGLRKNSIFFETFICILLWLGFWFKFSCTIGISDGVFREGVGTFNYSKDSFDKALFVTQIGMLSFIFSSYFREKFLFKYPKKINLEFVKLYFVKKNSFKILSVFLIVILGINLLNFYFKIYQKGLIPIYDINFLISGIFKWLLLFGLCAFLSIYVFYESRAFKRFFIFSSFVIFLETFITSLAMLSRGMIFNAFAILYGIYKYSKIVNIKNNINYYIKSTILILLLFYISVASVNYIRENFFYVGKSVKFTLENLKSSSEEYEDTTETEIKKLNTIQAHNSQILFLIINRWVGIDGVMAVTSKKEILNYKFFISSFEEKAKNNEPTFYEITFGLERNDGSNHPYENVKGNTLPGIIAFFYYPGSYYLLFIFIFIISTFSSLIEYFAFKYSGKNMIFSSLIGMTIAYRLIHFGYLPHQSYLLFGAIFLTIIIAYFINLIVTK